MENASEEELLAALGRGEEWALDSLFKSYYAFLCQTVFRMISDRNIAEDLVQEVFYELWRKRERLNVLQSVRAYLKRAAVNKTLNYIRDQKVMLDDESALPFNMESTEPGAMQQLEAAELQEHINQAIEDLPERCRIVFGLSRFEYMSNKQIAQELDISVKTVENQMTKALRMLREKLTPHLFYWIGWIFLAFGSIVS